MKENEKKTSDQDVELNLDKVEKVVGGAHTQGEQITHPFYTGQQKSTQARGRIDKFNKKYGFNR